MSLPGVQIGHPHVELCLELGGSPVVRGTRIAVRRIFAWHENGIAIETIAKRYPQLKLSHILDALSFALDNPALVRADLAREREALAKQAGQQA